MIAGMRFRGERGRQRILRSWLMLTGLTIGLMLGTSMWLLIQEDTEGAQVWFFWAFLVMLVSVYVSDVIRGVRRVPEDGPVPCCECCAKRREAAVVHLPPTPQPGDPPNLVKI
jgi:hypothetical protein